MTDHRMTDPIETLVACYLEAWSTTDSGVRERLVATVYAEDAEFFSSEDGDLRLTGRRAIADNIGRVNERDIKGRGLGIVPAGTSVNHRMARVAWQMVTPSGGVALAGMDVLVLDGDGRIAKDHIFIGA